MDRETYLLSTKKQVTKNNTTETFNNKNHFKINSKTTGVFFDKIQINFTKKGYLLRNARIIDNYTVIKLTYNDKIYRIKITKKKSNFIIISSFASFNLNLMAREWLKIKFNIKRTGTITSNKANFIPLHYKDIMIKNGLTFKKLRKTIIKKMHRQIEELKIVFVNEINKYFSSLPSYYNDSYDQNFCIFLPEDLETSFRSVEVCLDVKLPKGVSIIRKKGFLKHLNKMTIEANPTEYTDDNSNTVIPIVKISKSNNPMRRTIKGCRYPNNEGKFEMYPKEESKLGRQERFEAKNVQNDLSRIVKSRNFTNYDEFNNLLKAYAQDWRLFIKELAACDLNLEVSFNKNFLKEQLKLHFFRYWEELLEAFTTPPYSVSTRTESQIPKSTFYKIRKLTREKILFKQKARGIYEISEEWLELKNFTE